MTQHIITTIIQPATAACNMQQQIQQSMVDQAGQFAGTPLMDPTKNPQLTEEPPQPTE